MSGIKVGGFLDFINSKSAYDIAEDWDNVGLIVGDRAQVISGIVISINLGIEALHEAKSSGANVIVCHHPPLFKPILKITKSTHPYLLKALQSNISVIALHTNFDLSSQSLNKKICKRLRGKYISYLAERNSSVGGLPSSIKKGKFITYVPEKSLQEVRDAVFGAGGGVIDEYHQCSFSSTGTGTFQGSKNSNPKVGKREKFEICSETRLEVLIPWSKRLQIIRAARKAHPYESMAYDLIELNNTENTMGYGFVANTKLSFKKMTSSVKKVFKLRHFTLVAPKDFNRNLTVRKIAFSPGSGSSFVGTAASQGIEVYICGEVGYHQMIEARSKGLVLIILGHSYSERFFMETIQDWCREYSKLEKTSILAKIVFEKIDEVI